MPPVHFAVHEIDAWKEGSVGWVVSRAVMEIDGMPSITTRSTLVVREEGAHWRIVHWHISMPVANEESLGVGLTTAVEEILTMVQDEPPPTMAMAPDGTVTIVFTDIEGSTALMESLGEPRWLELLDWHDGVVRQQTGLFGGTVVKGQGDGFMLAFSAAGSAAACAVAIQRSLSSGWEGVPMAVARRHAQRQRQGRRRGLLRSHRRHRRSDIERRVGWGDPGFADGPGSPRWRLPRGRGAGVDTEGPGRSPFGLPCPVAVTETPCHRDRR